MAENLFKMAAYSGKFIQDGGGMLTSSIRRAHGVRTKVGRLRKHSVLKSIVYYLLLRFYGIQVYIYVRPSPI